VKLAGRRVYHQVYVCGVFSEATCEVVIEEESNAQEIILQKKNYRREKAKKHSAAMAKIKKIKNLKANKNKEDLEIKEKDMGEIGRQILTLKKKIKTIDSAPWGTTKADKMTDELKGPVLKIKKKKKLERA
jgi:hypothetical protein